MADDYDYGRELDDDWEDGGVVCKHCGKKNLEWILTGKGYRLLNPNGSLHTCHRPVASADDFEDLDEV